MTDPALPATAVVEEAETLWGLALQPAGCPQCGQAFLVQASRLGQVCPGCAAGRLESQPVRLRSEPPELLIPFQKQPTDLGSILDRFVKPVWLRPAELNTRLLLQRLTPLYWPMWLVDSDLSGDWQAEMGYDYQVKSSQESYTQGGWKTREQIETRIRWEPRLGQINRHYDNIAAPALENADAMIALIGSTQRKSALPYDPGSIGQASIRIPDLHPENTWPLAQSALQQAAAEDCRQAAQAQHQRSFSIQAAYANLHWTQLLQPLYATYYLDDQGKPQIVLVNGQSGVVGGPRRASQRKGCLWSAIGLGISSFLLIIYLLLVLVGRSIAGLSALAVMTICAALVMAGLAIVPALWPWQWNRSHQSRQSNPN
jgi:hypothetical protein